MKAFIYAGGTISPENVTEHPKSGDLVIAADSGYANARLLSVTPDVVLGDFDSFDETDIPRDLEKLKVPAEKDFTDTQLAVDTALKKGADEIVIIGGLDGRLDHTLSNLAILEDMWERSSDKKAPKRIFCVITDGKNRVRYIENDSVLIPKSGYRYLSVIARTKKLKGVEIKGCKYPLKNATIDKNFQFAVSNEIIGNCALIAIRKGGAYIVESV